MRCNTLSQFGRVVAMFAACLLVAAQVESAQAASFYSTKVITTTNPVLYWDLDEASGPTAADLSPINGSNTGTYSGTSTFGSAGPRPSDGFLGMNSTNNGSNGPTSDRVLISNLETGAGVGTAAYSAQIWFNSSVAFNSQTLSYFMSRGIGTGLNDRRDAVFVGGNFNSANAGILHLLNGNGNPSTVGTTVLNANTWYHAVMVRDDSLSSEQLKLYLNGNTTPEITVDGDWFVGTGGPGNIFAAGNRTDNNTGLGLTGTFDEVAIWNYALTPGEVQSLYNTAVIGFVPIPEPSSLSLLGLGVFGMLRYARRRKLHASRA